MPPEDSISSTAADQRLRLALMSLRWCLLRASLPTTPNMGFVLKSMTPYRSKSKRNCPVVLIRAIKRSMAMMVDNASLRRCVSTLIREPLAADLLERRGCALFVVHSKGLTVVIAEVELVYVALQVLFAY